MTYHLQSLVLEKVDRIMEKIYILSLEGGKFYVGRTKNFVMRLHQHQTGKGAAWTKKYSLVDVVEVIESRFPEDEDATVLRYMREHGVDNVRGGSFSRFDLQESDLKTIEQMTRGSKDTCFRCGGDHFMKDCAELPIKRPVASIKTIQKCKRCGNCGHTSQMCFANKCVRCGRDGHVLNECFAKTDVNGDSLSD